jgi:hypothetical protein
VVVLSIQQKVRPHNSHTYGYYYKYQEYKEHEPIHVIHLQEKRVGLNGIQEVQLNHAPQQKQLT